MHHKCFTSNLHVSLRRCFCFRGGQQLVQVSIRNSIRCNLYYAGSNQNRSNRLTLSNFHHFFIICISCSCHALSINSAIIYDLSDLSNFLNFFTVVELLPDSFLWTQGTKRTPTSENEALLFSPVCGLYQYGIICIEQRRWIDLA